MTKNLLLMKARSIKKRSQYHCDVSPITTFTTVLKSSEEAKEQKESMQAQTPICSVYTFSCVCLCCTECINYSMKKAKIQQMSQNESFNYLTHIKQKKYHLNLKICMGKKTSLRRPSLWKKKIKHLCLYKQVTENHFLPFPLWMKT